MATSLCNMGKCEECEIKVHAVSYTHLMEIYDTMQFGKGVVFPLNYKEAIAEIVGKIHSERILKRIYLSLIHI